ncbi:E2 domain-associated cysteine-rich protein [Aureimonas leprariae]|uniref:Uncharacterized protein n=1 Tax=Plantimonas leprariae TaxID=2615207 RepID=A0A7V7TXZ2_9HYPH|nr:E2 domain-associated cysteine-rich protein [Aureimonas leprariae]KAB0682046.1 hypothetical protein F6X38_04395 [Aureimonas leprariae]
MSALALLREVIEVNRGEFIRGDAGRMFASVRPLLDSGASGPTFLLEIAEVSDTLIAREAAPVNLPCFCPERHINSGGTFCLYWDEDEPLSFSTRPDIELWWGKLLIFLHRQIVAGRLRRWPGKGDARAHGQEASRFQKRAEIAASKLGPSFETVLREDRLTTRTVRGKGSRRLRLLLDGKKIATLNEERQQIMTLRSRCRCERSNHRRLPLTACEDHAGALADLGMSVRGRVEAERRFFEFFAEAKVTCCGTMDGCPLARHSDAAVREAA